jgi:hypothetical protein
MYILTKLTYFFNIQHSFIILYYTFQYITFLFDYLVDRIIASSLRYKCYGVVCSDTNSIILCDNRSFDVAGNLPPHSNDFHLEVWVNDIAT